MATLRGPWGTLVTTTEHVESAWCEDCGWLSAVLGLDPAHRHVWTLDGEPISAERANELVDAAYREFGVR